MKNKNSLSDRMKSYETTSKYKLLRRSYTIIRLDGLSFSKYTKSLPKPFDRGLVEDLVETTKYLCSKIQGCKLGYTQSDEITLVLSDFDDYKTQAWYDNEVQKMVSISASLATSKFNQLRYKRELLKKPNVDLESIKMGNFDARVFQVPTLIEVNNCLIWRQRDFYRNSISMCAQALYSHSELNNKNVNEMQEMIFQKGEKLKEKFIKAGFFINDKDNFNWNDLPSYLKRGTTVKLKVVEKVGENGDKIMRKLWISETTQYNSDNANDLPILDNSKL